MYGFACAIEMLGGCVLTTKFFTMRPLGGQGVAGQVFGVPRCVVYGTSLGEIGTHSDAQLYYQISLFNHCVVQLFYQIDLLVL